MVPVSSDSNSNNKIFSDNFDNDTENPRETGRRENCFPPLRNEISRFYFFQGPSENRLTFAASSNIVFVNQLFGLFFFEFDFIVINRTEQICFLSARKVRLFFCGKIEEENELYRFDQTSFHFLEVERLFSQI